MSDFKLIFCIYYEPYYFFNLNMNNNEPFPLNIFGINLKVVKSINLLKIYCGNIAKYEENIENYKLKAQNAVKLEHTY